MKLSKTYKAETYEDAEKLCPKGYRIPFLWELIKLAQEGKLKKLLNEEDGKFRMFWTMKTAEENSLRVFVACAGLCVGRFWYSGIVRLGHSYGSGRVVFVKVEK